MNKPHPITGAAAAEMFQQKWNQLHVQKREIWSQIELQDRKLRLLRMQASDNDQAMSICIQAAMMFGVSLTEDEQQTPEHSEAASLIDSPAIVAPRQSFKDIILDYAQRMYPQPIRARQTKEMLEKQHEFKGHEKTIGMTMYRLSKEGLLRRDGWNWFFVSENERNMGSAGASAPSSQNESADEPEGKA